MNNGKKSGSYSLPGAEGLVHPSPHLVPLGQGVSDLLQHLAMALLEPATQTLHLAILGDRRGEKERKNC